MEFSGYLKKGFGRKLFILEKSDRFRRNRFISQMTFFELKIVKNAHLNGFANLGLSESR